MSKTVAPPTNLWRVARLDSMAMNPEQRSTLIAWVAEVSGLSSDEIREFVRPVAAITQGGRDSVYRLHISRFVTDDQGRITVDHAYDEIQSEPLVFTIPNVPAWVLPAWREQLNGAT